MNFKRCILSFIVIISAISFLDAQVYDMIVDKNKEGAYKSIRNAIGRIPGGYEGQWTIFIANGIYEEKLHMYKDNVSLIGENVDSVIIVNSDHANDGQHGTSDSYTLWVDADGFYGENLTIENSAGNVGQAVALKTDGEKQVFKNCELIGFQDTYYAHSGMVYFLDCFIEGATDFIFGDATVVFDSCNINCVKGGQYVTAPADSKLTSVRTDGTTMIHGLFFNNCIVSADSDVGNNSYYLGRPWQPNSSTVYKNCTLGSHIKTLGWSTWSDDNHLSSYFAEYKSVDDNGELVDTTARAAWSYQISDSYAADYYNLEYFLTKDGESWNPIPISEALSAPANLVGSGYNITWQEVSGAVGYAIIRNDVVIDFSESLTYTDESADKTIANTYVVKSVNTYGNLSESSNKYSLEATGINALNSTEKLFRMQKNGSFIAERPVELNVWDLQGRRLAQYMDIQFQELDLKPGIYILKAVDRKGQSQSQKIIIK